MKITVPDPENPGNVTECNIEIYAGIGARKTPQDILRLMEDISVFMGTRGVILRSGAAHGADSAFERGCNKVGGHKQIYLPWYDYNNHKSNFTKATPKAFRVAATYHPKWAECSQPVRALHARNSHIIMGDCENMFDKSQLVICWSKGSGGTAQGLRIAYYHRIPVINLANKRHLSMVADWFKKKND